MVSSAALVAAVFVTYCVIALFVSIFLIKGFSLIYDAFDTYHYTLPAEFEQHCSTENHEREPVRRKIWLVGLYNAAGSATLAAFVLGIEVTGEALGTISSALEVSFSIQAIVGVAVLSVVLNSAIRVAALSSWLIQPADPDQDHVAIKNRILNFGFSFWTTIYILMLFGAGLGIAIWNVEQFGMPGLGLDLRGAIFGTFVVFILAPFGGAMVSELLLKYMIRIENDYKVCKDARTVPSPPDKTDGVEQA